MFDSEKYTKDWVLANISESDIFKRFLGIEPEFKAKYHNPLRIDKSADCSFYIRDDGRLIFNDFAWKKFDCFDVVMEKFQCSFIKAVKLIVDDVEIAQNPSSFIGKSNKVNIRIKRKRFTKEELAFWNQSDVKVTREDLESFNIFSIDAYWLNQNGWFNQKMSFAYHFGGFNYQLYFPLKEKGRFMNTSGLVIPHFTQNPVILTKSYKDCFFLSRFGIQAIYLISERANLKDEIIEKLRNLDVITLFDNDATGIAKTEEFQNLGFRTLLFDKDEGKDFTEVLIKNGSSYIIDWLNFNNITNASNSEME